MYEDFYGFVQQPFTLAPDPRFLYRSESHDQALTLLLRAIRRKEGLIVLTGDIGTGKTTVCRALVEELDAATFVSLVLNPFFSVEELLREVLLDFGIVSREAARGARLAAATTDELVTALHEFLRSLMAIKGTGVLIIDEAQHLPPQVLEQVCVLSNHETNEARLLQIVLAGQPTLLDALAGDGLRQLDARIPVRAALKPLTRDEVEAYVAHRLAVAGGRAAVGFEPETIDSVHACTGGVPRIINLLCDRALMAGAAAGVHRITPGLVDSAAHDLGLTVPHAAAPGPARRRLWLGTAAALVFVAAAAGTAVYLRSRDSRLEARPLPPSAPALARGAAAEAKPIPTADFLLPPMTPPPRPARPSREVPDHQVGLRRPPG